jgi:hypothetical protein
MWDTLHGHILTTTKGQLLTVVAFNAEYGHEGIPYVKAPCAWSYEPGWDKEVSEVIEDLLYAEGFRPSGDFSNLCLILPQFKREDQI